MKAAACMYSNMFHWRFSLRVHVYLPAWSEHAVHRPARLNSEYSKLWLLNIHSVFSAQCSHIQIANAIHS